MKLTNEFNDNSDQIGIIEIETMDRRVCLLLAMGLMDGFFFRSIGVVNRWLNGEMSLKADRWSYFTSESIKSANVDHVYVLGASAGTKAANCSINQRNKSEN